MSFKPPSLRVAWVVVCTSLAGTASHSQDAQALYNYIQAAVQAHWPEGPATP